MADAGRAEGNGAMSNYNPLPYRAYAQLAACVDPGNHRFTISLYHPDRAVCERCGLIRREADQ